MSTKAGVGFSRHRDTTKAAQEAIEKAMGQGKVSKPDLLMVFGADGYDHEKIVHAAGKIAPEAVLTGCSGEGVIADGHREEGHFGISAMVVKSDEMTFTPFSARGLRSDSEQVGRSMAQQLTAANQKNPFATMLFADGLTLNFAALMRGFGVAPDLAQLPLIGGGAGDFRTLTKTYQYNNAGAYQDGISGVMVSGEGTFVHAHTHGCIPVTRQHMITKVDGNRILTIDDKPVGELIKIYHPGGWTPDLAVSICFAFKTQGDSQDDFCIRCIFGLDEQTGAVTLNTEVPLGPVWLAARDPNKIMTGVHDTVSNMQNQMDGTEPKFVFHVECGGRGSWMLPEAQSAEIIGTLRKTAPRVPWMGFYSYGEYAPVGSTNSFFNYTSVLGAFF